MLVVQSCLTLCNPMDYSQALLPMEFFRQEYCSMLSSPSPWGSMRQVNIWVSIFPGNWDGKESACNARDLGLIPGWGSCPGEGNGDPLQYSCLQNSMDRGAWWPMGGKESNTTERLTHTHTHTHIHYSSSVGLWRVDVKFPYWYLKFSSSFLSHNF